MCHPSSRPSTPMSLRSSAVSFGRIWASIPFPRNPPFVGLQPELPQLSRDVYKRPSSGPPPAVTAALGHNQPIEACRWPVRSAAYSGQNAAECPV